MIRPGSPTGAAPILRQACQSIVAAVIAIFSLLYAGSAHAGDPTLSFRTIESRHFIITYYDREEHLAQRVAVVAERAHERLAPLFDHAPRRKVHILLTDETDDSNGSATVIPYGVVRLFATAPDDRSELNDYDDWLEALITHEYTHIIHLDTIHGIARVVNAILGFGEYGQLYVPNQMQPRFLIEGLAVFEETEFTSAGRLRSTIYDMFLRTATLAGRFQRLDQFANYPIQWPRGASPYLYGSAFCRYIASLYGPDVFRRLAHEQGGAWIPGGINRALRRVTGGRQNGQTFETLYDGFRASMAERYKKQLAAVEARGRVEGTPLTEPREYAVRPTFTPDGESVVWSDSDGKSRARIRRIPGGKPLVPNKFDPGDTVLLVDSSGGTAFSPDARTLYFNAVEVHRSIYYYNDLFAYDVEAKEKRQLTFGLRAAEPALSPDGKTLAFDVNDLSSRSLALMPAAGGPVTTLVGNHDDLSQIYTPAWSPDGKTIAFSWWRPGGYRDIWLVDVATRELTRLTSDRALDLDPRYSPDGQYLYFSSDRSGIYNLYAFEFKTNKTFQITNLIGGAFDPAISPDGKRCVYVGFTADGYRLERIDLDPAAWLPAKEALLDRPDADTPRVEKELPAGPYQPWRTIWPRTFTASSYPDAFGQVFALTLGGSDLAGIHAWNASLGVGIGRADDVTFSAAYSYNRLFASLNLSAYRLLTRRGGFYIDGINHGYLEEDYSATASVNLPILRAIDKSADLSVAYNLAWMQNLDRARLPLDPTLISPVLPETGRVASIGLGFSYANLRRFTYSVSTAQGRALSISLGFAQRALGSQFNVATAYWRYVEFVPMPIANHVLLLSYGGGVSGGDLKHRGAFYIGGYAVQADPFRALFDFTRAGGAQLRGYPSGFVGGDQFHVLNAEYRFPIIWIERGYGTFPLYIRRIHGAAYADYGNAFSGPFDIKNFKVGVGGEVRLDLFLFYYFGATVQVGYARGLSDGGINEYYFLLNSPY